MTLTQTDYVRVYDRMAALGLTSPSGLTFLPDNFEHAERGDDLLFRGEATTVGKLLKQAGVPIARLGPDASAAFIHNKSHDWAIPVIFVGAELMKQSPDMVGMAIDLIRDYVVGLFEGTKDRKIKAEVVIEDRARKRFQKVTYEGDAEGLKELAELVKRLGE